MSRLRPHFLIVVLGIALAVGLGSVGLVWVVHRFHEIQIFFAILGLVILGLVAWIVAGLLGDETPPAGDRSLDRER